MNRLAVAYQEAGQWDKALPLHEQALERMRAKQRAQPNDPNFATLLAAVSLDLLQLHQYQTAEGYLREWLTIRQKKLPDDWLLFNTKSMLGGALAGQKKFQEAEPLLIEGYEGMNERQAKIPAPGKIRIPEAVQRLIELYDAWGKPDEAAEWRKKLEAAKSDSADVEKKP